jgi:hypothetical protein
VKRKQALKKNESEQSETKARIGVKRRQARWNESKQSGTKANKVKQKPAK